MTSVHDVRNRLPGMCSAKLATVIAWYAVPGLATRYRLSALLHATAGTGVSHQIDRIHVPKPTPVVGLHGVHHLAGDRFPGVCPGVKDLVVSLLVRNHTTFVELLVFEDLLFSVHESLTSQYKQGINTKNITPML